MSNFLVFLTDLNLSIHVMIEDGMKAVKQILSQ